MKIWVSYEKLRNFQYIQDDRINERNHTKIESIGRVGVTFKAMVDL